MECAADRVRSAAALQHLVLSRRNLVVEFGVIFSELRSGQNIYEPAQFSTICRNDVGMFYYAEDSRTVCGRHVNFEMAHV